MYRKVRVGSLYAYDPVLLDVIDRTNLPFIEDGQIVRVINLRGCPKANTMGHCYIENWNSHEFLGMVCTNSLKPLVRKGKKFYIKEEG